MIERVLIFIETLHKPIVEKFLQIIGEIDDVKRKKMFIDWYKVNIFFRVNLPETGRKIFSFVSP